MIRNVATVVLAITDIDALLNGLSRFFIPQSYIDLYDIELSDDECHPTVYFNK